MGNPRCSWVRDRLPLLAGGELVGQDRRRVERHLIGCPACRDRRQALAGALDVLHSAAGAAPVAAEAPSLWPALERQFREARRPAPPLGLWWGLVVRPRLAPALGLALAVLAAGGIRTTVQRQKADARSQILAARRPLAPLVPRLTPPPPPVPAPEPSEMAQAEPSPEPPAARYDYDLDHGTPMGLETAERKTTSKPTY